MMTSWFGCIQFNLNEPDLPCFYQYNCKNDYPKHEGPHIDAFPEPDMRCRQISFYIWRFHKCQYTKHEKDCPGSNGTGISIYLPSGAATRRAPPSKQPEASYPRTISKRIRCHNGWRICDWACKFLFCSAVVVIVIHFNEWSLPRFFLFKIKAERHGIKWRLSAGEVIFGLFSISSNHSTAQYRIRNTVNP